MTMEMDSVDISEKAAEKISDSGYSNSCSNSHSHKSNSTTSLHSGSNSRGSSGYGDQRTSSNSKENHSIISKDESSTQKCDDRTDGVSEIPLGSEILDANQNAILGKFANYKIASILHKMDMELPDTMSFPCDKTRENSTADRLLHRASALKTADKLGNITNLSIQNNGDGTISTGNTILKSPTFGQDHNNIFTVTTANKQEMTTYKWLAMTKPAQTDNKPLNNDFNCVVSMHNGIIMYVTSLSSTSLGYPKDMWVGRAFMDFVHPKDRGTLTNYVSAGVAQPLFNTNTTTTEDTYRSTMFCRFRRYRGIHRSGYRVKRNSITYDTYFLTMTFKNITEIDNKTMYLIIHARPILSAYTSSSEIMTKITRFMTQHTADGLVSHVDVEAIPYWGYLPQDLLQKFILDCYHPDDLPYLKQVYETVITTGCRFKSKPYRFLAHNGDYILMDTDWSSFVNPWTRKVEFIVGHHRVLGGPINSNIFEEPEDDWKRTFDNDVLKQCREIHKQIIDIMREELKKPTNSQCKEKDKHQVAAFMESLVYECSRVDQELKIDIPSEDDPSISERDSIMFGEISPHHDYYDSKSSTETPPSYNQLNYNENLQRFFESYPSTNFQDLPQASVSSDLDLKISSLSQPEARKCMSPIQQGSGGSQESGSSGEINANRLSSANISTKANGTTWDEDNNSLEQTSYFPHLTETILTKHNLDMEKILFKKHREARSVSKAAGEREKQNERRERKKDFMSRYTTSITNNQHNQNITATQESKQIAGGKRPSSQSWDNNENKIVKYMMSGRNQKSAVLTPSEIPQNTPEQGAETILQQSIKNVDLTGVTPNAAIQKNNNSHQVSNTELQPSSYSIGVTSGFPLISSVNSQIQTTPVQNSTYVLYPSFGTQQYVYSPINTMTYQVWANGFCTPTTTSSIQHRPEQGLFCLPHSNYQQTIQDKDTIVTNKKVTRKINSHSTPRRTDRKIFKRSLHDFNKSGLIRGLGLKKSTESVSEQDGQRCKKTYYDCSSITNEEEEDELSSYSSFYSSFLKTSNGSNDGSLESNKKLNKGVKSDTIANKPTAQTDADKEVSIEQSTNDTKPKDEETIKSDHSKRQIPFRKPEPPWLDEVKVTSELVYRYQLNSKSMEETLKSDLETLKSTNQPSAVDDQLSQLYTDMQLQGFHSLLTIEDGITSSSSSEEEVKTTTNSRIQIRKRKREYSTMTMLYEEDAPFPPPNLENDEEKPK